MRASATSLGLCRRIESDAGWGPTPATGPEPLAVPWTVRRRRSGRGLAPPARRYEGAPCARQRVKLAVMDDAFARRDRRAAAPAAAGVACRDPPFRASGGAPGRSRSLEPDQQRKGRAAGAAQQHPGGHRRQHGPHSRCESLGEAGLRATRSRSTRALSYSGQEADHASEARAGAHQKLAQSLLPSTAPAGRVLHVEVIGVRSDVLEDWDIRSANSGGPGEYRTAVEDQRFVLLERATSAPGAPDARRRGRGAARRSSLRGHLPRSPSAWRPRTQE